MNGNDIPSPVFTPRPGWGGQLSAWAERNRRTLTIVAALIVVLAGVTLLFRRSPVQLEATPTPVTAVVEVQAQFGDSITTLARRALQLYILSHSTDVSLTDVQEIYVETLLKNELGEQNLSVGQTLAFPHTSIERAIDASQHMSDYQIRFYSQFIK